MTDTGEAAGTLRVAWNHNVDPPVPVVSEVFEAGDGHPAIRVHDKNESLRRFHAALASERARSQQLEDALREIEAEHWQAQWPHDDDHEFVCGRCAGHPNWPCPTARIASAALASVEEKPNG